MARDARAPCRRHVPKQSSAVASLEARTTERVLAATVADVELDLSIASSQLAAVEDKLADTRASLRRGQREWQRGREQAKSLAKQMTALEVELVEVRREPSAHERAGRGLPVEALTFPRPTPVCPEGERGARRADEHDGDGPGRWLRWWRRGRRQEVPRCLPWEAVAARCQRRGPRAQYRSDTA